MPSSGLKTLPKVAMAEGEVVLGEAEGRTLEEDEVYLVKAEDGEGAEER